MDKFEAAETLGVSVRTLMNMISKGQISGEKKRGATGLQYDFDRDEIERVKREREQGTHVAALVRQSPGQSMAPVSLPALPSVFSDPVIYEVIEKVRGSIGAVSLKDKLTLNVDEASELSGLGKGFIRQAIEEKKLMAIAGAGHRGSTVIKRSDLDAFIESLGKGRKR